MQQTIASNILIDVIRTLATKLYQGYIEKIKKCLKQLRIYTAIDQ